MFLAVTEFQARGAVHAHALVHHDGRDPGNPFATLPPAPGISAGQLALLLRAAGGGTTDAGVPVHVLRKIAGHGSLTTTRRYLHPDQAAVSAAATR